MIYRSGNEMWLFTTYNVMSRDVHGQKTTFNDLVTAKNAL